MQQTSIDAYISVKPKLGNRQHAVFSCLKTIEPACNKSIAKELDMPINEITPRINELRYKGVVEQAYKAKYDGRTVIFWQTTTPDAIKLIRKD